MNEQIDWSKAPTDATHCFPAAKGACWRKYEEGSWWSFVPGAGWCVTSGALPEKYLARPVYTGAGSYAELITAGQLKPFKSLKGSENPMWKCPAPAIGEALSNHQVDFNKDVILESPPVRIGIAKPVRVSFDGAEDQGRVWLMVDAEFDEDEPWIAIEGNENCRRLGELLIAWADAGAKP